MSRYGLAMIVVFALLGRAGAEENWPQFRGGNQGIAKDGSPPQAWSKTKNVAWVADVKGRGWSCPVVWGDKIFVTACINANTPEPRKGLYIQDLQGKTPPGEHRWVTTCLDYATGKTVWEKTAHVGIPKNPIHLKNTYASETPATDGERLYVYFGNVGVFCYDLNGKELWTKTYPAYKMRTGWGSAASPIYYKDRLYVVNDNEEKSFLAALDAKTGKEIWHVDRKEGSNWAPPFIWENEQRTEIITCGTGKVRSYDLDGKLLWEFKGMSTIAIPVPSAAHGLLYISSGYVGDNKWRPVYAIKPGASGDISLADGTNSNKFIVWCQRLAGPYHPTPLVYGDYIYVLLDRGNLSCYEAKTGKKVYTERISFDSDKFTASPWVHSGKIFCLSEDGETFVVQPGPKFSVLGRNSLDEMTLCTPAVVRDSVILRTASKVYRIAEKGKK